MPLSILLLLSCQPVWQCICLEGQGSVAAPGYLPRFLLRWFALFALRCKDWFVSLQCLLLQFFALHGLASCSLDWLCMVLIRIVREISRPGPGPPKAESEPM